MPAPKLSNKDALEALTAAGYNIDTDFERTIIIEERYSYSGRSIRKLKYYIPRETWTKVTGKRFNIPFRKGMRVNLKKDKAFNKVNGGTRFYPLRSSFIHYGFGSGKVYPSTASNPKRFYGDNNRTIKVGRMFFINPIAAKNKANRLNIRGSKWRTRNWKNKISDESLSLEHFPQKIKLNMDGVMAPKKLMTGVITDIFIYMYKWWNYKRESRYLVLFENGSSAMLRRCDIEKCKVSDFNSKDNAYQCSKVDDCKQHKGCTHSPVHVKDEECDIACPDHSDAHCKACFDFKQLNELVYSDGAFQEDK